MIVGLDAMLWLIIAGFALTAHELKHDAVVRAVFRNYRQEIVTELHAPGSKFSHRAFAHRQARKA